MSDLLTERAAELPQLPGVYLFKDKRGKVLYVGKAASLRARVRQYLAGSDERQMVPFLVRAAHDVEVVVTSSEKEALLLENTLIKKHQPRYNVKLRDDSNFLHLRLDLKRTWPMYEVVRHIGKDGSKYFGPYHSASKARQTLAFLQRAFPLRTCSDAVLNSRRRPCLLYQMDRCVAPCVDKVSPEEYAELAKDSTLLLQGRKAEAVEQLRKRMMRAAEAEAFERAARLRDLIFSIESTIERQTVIDAKRSDRDVWGYYTDGTAGAVAMLPMREGILGEPRAHLVPSWAQSVRELLSTVLLQAYADSPFIPAEIVVPEPPADLDTLEELLSERRGSRVQIVVPQRGKKVKLVDLAHQNAKVRFIHETDEAERHRQAMEALAKACELETVPERIECFDNSHIQGAQPVSAMSVFLDGRPARKEYRRYRIKRAQGGDDYAMMREILDRRFRRAREQGVWPDLLVVDGGRGQLNVAMAVLSDLGIHDQAVVGIAKPRTEHAKGDKTATDKLVLPHRKDLKRLRPGHPGLRILQHIRDEAHRTVVRYHRKVRSKETLTSVLEGIAGVGPSRRKALLKAFGSLDDIADASVAELAAVDGVGPALAEAIHSALNPAPQAPNDDDLLLD